MNEFLLFPHGRGKSSLVLDPSPNEAMNDLYNTLAKALDLQEERGFKPHVGLGLLKMSESQIRRLISKYEANWKQLTWTVFTHALLSCNLIFMRFQKFYF